MHRQAHVTLQSQDPTFAVCIEVLILPWQLLAEGVKEDGGHVCRSTGALVRSGQHYARQENEA